MAPVARYRDMDKRLADLRPTFWQSAAAGCAVALLAGLSVGGYFKVGYSMAAPGSGESRIEIGETAPEPIQYMTDASGRVPDYVLGTDFTAASAPEPVFASYEPEPLPAWTPPEAPAQEATVQQASYSETAAPPSLAGDILAGLRPVSAAAAAEAPPATAGQAAQIGLEDGADPSAFRPRPSETTPVALAVASATD